MQYYISIKRERDRSKAKSMDVSERDKKLCKLIMEIFNLILFVNLCRNRFPLILTLFRDDPINGVEENLLVICDKETL